MVLMAPSSDWQFPGNWGQTGGQPWEILQPLGWHGDEGRAFVRLTSRWGRWRGPGPFESKIVPGQMRVSWDESGDASAASRSRAKRETNKEGKSCAAPRRCCPRSQISLRTYYGYFSCGPLLQSLPRNRNRARLFGIMFRWRQEWQEVLIPDIRGCRASSSFHIPGDGRGADVDGPNFCGKKVSQIQILSLTKKFGISLLLPHPLCAFCGLCQLCSYVHVIRLQPSAKNWEGGFQEPLILAWNRSLGCGHANGPCASSAQI